MKFTLKDYQAEAVDDVLQTLRRARELYRDEGRESSVALTATTGAGKTVMAAAVIETLFYGSEDFDVAADPGAVIIWFSDDPSLNEQTKARIAQSTEKLTHDQLVTIQYPFSKAKLEARTVYFLNTQRLTKSSRLTLGHVDPDDAEVIPGMKDDGQPDMQGWTIWQTVANTINDDSLNVYMILDEAHRGFNKRKDSEKPTIVRKLVNGHAGYPPMPIVWGVSATISRFKEAMAESDADEGRRAFPPINVDPARVQDSGLVKDMIVLDVPDEHGNFDTVLVRRAAMKLKDSSERWERYASSQGLPDAVKPLLVLQIPNKQDNDQVGRWLDEILKVFPEWGGDAVRHVLGDAKVEKFGSWEVERIEPQRVEGSTRVRVLVAKDGVSTGWDCPRAEVLVSFRSPQEQDHITQLLGRMVRNPLARKIPGDDRLNSVDCILPFVDKTTAGKVVKFLTGEIPELPGSGRQVLLDGRELKPNAAIPDYVWTAWDIIPNETLPKRGSRPVKRLVSLAQALSADGLRPGAIADAESEMHTVLESLAVRYDKQLKSATEEVWAVRGLTLTGQQGQKITYEKFVELADDRAIRVGFEDAKRAFGADVAQSYVNHLAGDDEDDDDLRDAYVKVSALAIVGDVRARVDQEADELADNWFDAYRVAIKGLTDERQQEYEQIRAEATTPQLGELMRPRTRMEDYAVVLDDGQIAVAPLATRHLMSDENGEFPLSTLNEWEFEVVQSELAQPGSVAWYRNPPRASVDSLGVTYRDQVGNWRSMHPDFIFFTEKDGKAVPSIVDPHGHHLDDSLVKLQALARFAGEVGSSFHRIEALAKIGKTMRVLDLQIPDVRVAVESWSGPVLGLYSSPAARDYNPAI